MPAREILEIFLKARISFDGYWRNVIEGFPVHCCGNLPGIGGVYMYSLVDSSTINDLTSQYRHPHKCYPADPLPLK